MNECRYCQQWEVATDDTYCSFCGHLLLLLEIEPESLVLISGIAPVKELKLRNDSPRAMQISIGPRDGKPLPGVSFTPASVVDVPSKGIVQLQVSVDVQKLAPGFHRVSQYVCTVDEDPRKQRSLHIEVRSGPSPRLLTPAIDFNDVEEGKSVERTLELTNAGNVTLRIRSILAEGSLQLRIASDYADRLVKYGEKLSVPVLWETLAGVPPATAQAAVGIRIEFANHSDVLFVPASAHTFRYRLELKPDFVSFKQALAKREYVAQVRLENSGTTDAEILSIESDQAWLAVVARATRFTLLADSTAPRTMSPTTFVRTFDIKLVARPKELAKGRHQATVTVRPHGHEPLLLPVDITVVEAKDYPDYIGIDFGTTNSVVAILNRSDASGVSLVQDEASGKLLIPSVLVFDDPESYKIGDAAKNEASTAPDRTVRSIKRVMGYEQNRTFFDRSYSAAELASLIIRKLVQLAERKLHIDATNGFHFDVRKAIITVPANFHDLQIRDVLEACKHAGLDIEEERSQRVEKRQSETIGAMVNAGIILDEPTAAVLYYIHYLRRMRSSAEITRMIEREQGLTLLVFDYGGGTLDVAVASATVLPGGGTGLRILANKGDNTIGGDHIDVMIMQELLRRCRQELRNFDFDTSLIAIKFKELQRRGELEGWSYPVWAELLRVRGEWKELGETAKIRIAEQKQVAIEILPDLIVRVAGGVVEHAQRAVKIQPLPAEVTNNILQPVLTRCEELINASLELAGIAASDVDYILHTGRQSLLPQIRKCVRGMFRNLTEDRDLLEKEHLKVCVAKGAALYGSMRDRLVDPQARILLLNDGRKLPHSYGVETFSNPVHPEFDEVIRRGAEYPVEHTKRYPPEMIPASGYLNLKFYQNTGTSKAIIGNPNVSLIGQISFDTAGTPGCDVRFVVGANRTLNVYANEIPVNIEPARLHEEESWTG